MEKSDFFSGLALLVFGSTMAIGSMNYPYGELNNPGAGFFPRITSLVLIIISLFLIATAVRKYREKKGDVVRRTFFPTKDAPKRIILACLFLLGYRLLFPFLGFVPTTLLFFLLFPSLLGNFGWRTSFIFSLLSTLTVYLLFEVFLKIQMPTGIL